MLLAKREDQWDKILKEMHGIDDENSKPIWATVPLDAQHEVRQQLRASYMKNTSVARRMYEIVEQEKALAEAEEVGAEEAGAGRGEVDQLEDDKRTSRQDQGIS